MGDYNTIIFDCGTSLSRVGFSGEDLPRYVIPSLVGKPKSVPIMTGFGWKEWFVGDEAISKRSILTVQHPIQHGHITNWDYMEQLWNFLYNQCLKVQSEDYPVLITEPSLSPKISREKLCQTMFETYNVPALYLANQQVLALYATGHTTGVMVDSGDGVTYISPIVDSKVIQDAIPRFNISGNDITNYLAKLLNDRKNGIEFNTSQELDIVREIKEKYSFVNDGSNSIGDERYQLPDGSILKLDKERNMCTEPYFDPSIIDSNYQQSRGGIQHAIKNAVSKCDTSLHQVLYSNIVLSGGSTMFPGFGERIHNELVRLDIGEAKVTSPLNRRYSSWIGGSILSDLSTFRNMVISKEEYDENGPTIISKCSNI